MFEVSVSPPEFDVTRGGSVVGPIWVRIAGADFPEPDWPDFPVALLGGWLTTLSELEAGGPGPATLHFMEGPYELEVTRASTGDAWRLRARRNGTEIVAETIVPSVAGLVTPMRAAASEVLAACRDHGWRGSDVTYLAGLTAT